MAVVVNSSLRLVEQIMFLRRSSHCPLADTFPGLLIEPLVSRLMTDSADSCVTLHFIVLCGIAKL